MSGSMGVAAVPVVYIPPQALVPLTASTEAFAMCLIPRPAPAPAGDAAGESALDLYA